MSARSGATSSSAAAVPVYPLESSRSSGRHRGSRQGTGQDSRHSARQRRGRPAAPSMETFLSQAPDAVQALKIPASAGRGCPAHPCAGPSLRSGYAQWRSCAIVDSVPGHHYKIQALPFAVADAAERLHFEIQAFGYIRQQTCRAGPSPEIGQTTNRGATQTTLHTPGRTTPPQPKQPGGQQYRVVNEHLQGPISGTLSRLQRQSPTRSPGPIFPAGKLKSWWRGMVRVERAAPGMRQPRSWITWGLSSLMNILRLRGWNS